MFPVAQSWLSAYKKCAPLSHLSSASFQVTSHMQIALLRGQGLPPLYVTKDVIYSASQYSELQSRMSDALLFVSSGWQLLVYNEPSWVVRILPSVFFLVSFCILNLHITYQTQAELFNPGQLMGAALQAHIRQTITLQNQLAPLEEIILLVTQLPGCKTFHALLKSHD